MKKRIISLLLVFCTVLSLFPVTALAVGGSGEKSANSANPFTDVKETDWFYDAVQYAYANGFFGGTTATTFDPQGTMTRGMFVTVLGRMAGVDTTAYLGQSAFTDVPADQYYAPYVAWAAKHGITSGTGDGRFSPDAQIDRQQLAVFFVRYFEAFDVNYETDANITATPADIDTVAPYARDAVLKLWKQGLLNGDGKNFDPGGHASRAQAATLCTRTDGAVETWYKEPGVPSQRVSVDPTAPQQPEEPKKPTSSGSTSGGSSTRYYEVQFALGNEQSVDITLPATSTYPANTLISSLPTPAKAGAIFLGWYYDAAMTDGVETGDTVNRNMTLYAKAAAGDAVTSLETPNYVTRTEVEAGTYTFDVIGAADIDSAFKFINITGGNVAATYTVSKDTNTVSATLEPGQTYQVELTDDAARFKLSGESEAQPESIRYLNILTAKAEVTNAELNKGVKQISAEGTGIDPKAFNGLYQMDTQGYSTENTTSGTFTYTGKETLQVGDTVAITSGNVNLSDVTSTTGDVAYVKITAKDGTTYSYEMADLEDVLFIPDVLPIQSGWDTDSTDNQITVSASHIATAMSNVEADSLDVGDFIGFLAAGVVYSDSATAASYGKITGVTAVGDCYVITYTTANENAVEGALDVYYTQDREIDLTDEEIDQIETEVKNDVQDSGYVEEAALYLASMMLESNNLEEIPDMEQVAYSMRTMQASSVQYGNGTVTRAGNGNTVTVRFDKTNMSVDVSANSQLGHLNGNGFDVSVTIPFVVTIAGSDGNKVQIKITATFEEEVILKQKISTKRHKIGFLKYDYSLNASFEVGNYTGIDFQADVYTADSSNEALTEKLEKIMDKMEEYQSSGTSADDGTMESLAEIYQDVMEKANDTWIDIINVKLFETNGNAFLHIFCWQVKGSFVVSANLCVSMGMEFDYTMQKQYNFSVRVKAKTATNQTIDIIEPQYNFNFYVVGTIGIRAGLRLEMYVGLFSLKLDKIGITAEVGAYARLWGYFFYHLEWTQSSGKKTNSAGAMLVEIGIYLEIKFVAQVFNSKKLTWNPTLYAHEWPLWSAGEQKNVYAFNNTDAANYTLKTTRTLALPGNTYLMKYMDLKDGKTGFVSKDDGAESSFIISFSNPVFSYSPATNTVTVTPAKGSLAEETDMIITWKKAALSFTSKPIQKVIHLAWSDPEGLRYISFDSMGGSAVAQISAGSGAAITWPADPTKQGYTFEGWYTDSGCTAAYSGSTAEMPTFSEGTKGMTLYAKWTPAAVSYTVEHYLEELNGTYKLDSTQTNLTGTTGETTNAQAYGVYVGFTAKDVEQQTIAADGSTVVKVYYDRETYTVTFKDGVSDANDITQTYRYGEAIVAPILAREGYTFSDWGGTLPETATETATYTAQWLGNENTVIFANRDGSAVESKIVRTGDKVPQPAEPTKTGYIFGGWYSDQNCTKVWNFNTDTVSGDLILYAKWTANSHTITFDTAGGTEIAPITGNYGIAVTAPANPTKAGYTFEGWDREIPATMPAENMTITAKWTANSYTVKFDGNGATSGTMADQTGFTYDVEQALTPNGFSRTGHTFAGWATSSTAATADYTDEKPVKNLSSAANGEVTLYAVWTVNSYGVTVNDGDTISGEQAYGTTVTISAGTKTGYTFKDWTVTSGNTVLENVGAETTTFTMPAADVTVTANWTANSYKVVFNANGGTGNMAEQSFTYDADPEPLTVNGFSREGYTFVGWATSANDSKAYDDTASVSNLTSAANGAVTLYAVWTVNSYAVTITDAVAISDEQAYGSTITINAGTKTGYTFTGWTVTSGNVTLADASAATTTFTMPANAVAVTANWTANTYTVVFDANTGTGTMDGQTFTYDVGKVLPECTYSKDAHAFASWNTQADGKGTTYAGGASVKNLTSVNGETVTLYAVWRADIEVDTFEKLESRIKNAATDGTKTEIVIAADMESTSAIEVPTGANIVITCKDSYTLTRGAGVDDCLFLMQYQSTLSIDGLTMIGTDTTSEPAISMNNSCVLNLTDCTIKKMSNTGEGGAIYANGTVNAVNCVFTENEAQKGGAIGGYYSSQVNLTGCTFTKNSASTGGAIAVKQQMVVSAENCVFEENVASAQGGAIYAIGDTGEAVVIMKNSLLQKNQTTAEAGTYGGAFYGGQLSKLIFDGCSIVENTATSSSEYSRSYGGGGFVNNGKLYMNNCTVAHNAVHSPSGANVGSGLHIESSFTTNPVECYLMNSTIVGNVGTLSGAGVAFIDSLADVTDKAYIWNCVIADNISADGNVDVYWDDEATIHFTLECGDSLVENWCSKTTTYTDSAVSDPTATDTITVNGAQYTVPELSTLTDNPRCVYVNPYWTNNNTAYTSNYVLFVYDQTGAVTKGPKHALLSTNDSDYSYYVQHFQDGSAREGQCIIGSMRVTN